jgi:hypothetical protein
MLNNDELEIAILRIIDTLVPGYTNTTAQRMAFMAIIQSAVEDERTRIGLELAKDVERWQKCRQDCILSGDYSGAAEYNERALGIQMAMVSLGFMTATNITNGAHDAYMTGGKETK